MIENIQDVDITKAQILAIVGSLLFFIFILYQIKSKNIKEEYSLLWLLFSFIAITFSIWREGLTVIAKFAGIAYPPAALFLFLLVIIFFILIQFSILISKLADRNKTLTQEHALLKHEFEELQKEVEKLKNVNNHLLS